MFYLQEQVLWRESQGETQVLNLFLQTMRFKASESPASE